MFLRRTGQILTKISPPRPSIAATATRFVSSSNLSASLDPTPLPRPPQKHKAKKSKSKTSSLLPTLEPIPSTLASSSASAIPISATNSAKDRNHRASDGKVIALCTAEAYDTPALLKGLQALGLLEGTSGNGAVNLMGEAIYIPRWSPSPSTATDSLEVGEIFIFESGTIVSWGLSPRGIESFLRQVIRGSPATAVGKGDLGWVERGRYAESESELLDYWVDGTDPSQHINLIGDALHLYAAPSPPSLSHLSSPPNRDLLARLALSAGMARTTKLGVYEEQFDEFSEGTAGIPKLLESGSESPVKKTDIIKRVGKLHGFRQKLNLEDENLLDEPEFLWEDAALHQYYTSVCNTLEFDSRLRTLNQRVDYAFQLQSTLMDLLNTKTSHRLEWIIIILIAFEITIVLLREGFALSHGGEEKEKEKSIEVAV